MAKAYSEKQWSALRRWVRENKKIIEGAGFDAAMKLARSSKGRDKLTFKVDTSRVAPLKGCRPDQAAFKEAMRLEGVQETSSTSFQVK